MFRFAVCDDTTEYLEQTAAYIDQWALQKDLSVTVDTFDNGDVLINALKNRSYDLILLDIIMPMLSGIDTCAEIRKENRQTKIVFLSVSPEFGVDAFRVKANGYLLKPVAPNVLFSLLDECLSEWEENTQFLIAKSASILRKIPLDDVFYIEAQNKHILIYTSDGNTLSVTTPLHQLAQQLEDNRFCQCHRSYIVNMNYVRSFSKTELVLSNGHTIPISRSCAKDFQNIYFAFLFGKAGDR